PQPGAQRVALRQLEQRHAQINGVEAQHPRKPQHPQHPQAEGFSNGLGNWRDRALINLNQQARVFHFNAFLPPVVEH
ncbi:hypothetical protein, partial [Pseudomonas syringae]|uniref:hypothetical protein n=1 Tax=Pseudomonas syringae TaxID=317 RepID=UPI003F770634